MGPIRVRIGRRQPLGDSRELGLRRRQRDAVGELANHEDQPGRPIAQRGLSSREPFVRQQRNPHLRDVSEPRTLKLFGSHADDGGRVAIENHRLSDDVTGAVKLFLPHSIADHRNESGCVEPILLVAERSAQNEVDTESIEEIVRHQAAVHGVTSAWQAQREALELGSQDLSNSRRRRHILEIVWVAVLRLRTSVQSRPEGDEPPGLDAPCRFGQDAVHHRKNRGVASND